MNEVLTLGSDGWLLGGHPWQPDGPWYAVLGDPIAHSLSPAIQNAALRERELDSVYLPVRLQAGQLRRLKDGPAGALLAGFNVTAPLKEAVAALCDGRTDQARDLGAVNTVRVEDGRWLGHNTDSGGTLTVLSQAFSQAGGGEEPPSQAVVMGAGGSARAAVDALVRWEVPQIEVWNRSRQGQDKIRQWLAGRGLERQVSVKGLPTGKPAASDESCVYVCCLAGGVEVADYLPDAAGAKPSLLLDLRYGDQRPGEEPPLGFGFSDGLPVLLMQGGLSFAWWHGAPVAWQAMRTALESDRDR